MDIAVLEPSTPLSASQAPETLSFARSIPNIGDVSYVLGNPLGIDHASISEGIVRDNAFFFRNNVRSIHTSSQSHSGSSGGPITNREGEVIAILSAGPGDFESLSWGVSTIAMLPVATEIIKSRRNYRAGSLRAKLNTPQPLYAISNSLPSMNGVLVSESLNPLLKDKDFIVSIEDQAVGSSSHMGQGLIPLSAGKNLRLKLYRDGKLISVFVECTAIAEGKETILGA
tara:strand:+ start:134 stop:817 length:684 start_codon:yes stop_codon:yes gene_type:complete